MRNLPIVQRREITRANAFKGLDVLLQHKLAADPDTDKAWQTTAAFEFTTQAEGFADMMNTRYPESTVIYRVVSLSRPR